MNEQTSSRVEEERDLRAALQHAVSKICEAEDALDSGGARMSRSAVAALSELTYQYATTSLSNDLTWFARHANRRTISVDDVKLVARKNPNRLLEQLESFTDQQKLSKGNHTMEALRKENKKKASPKKQRSKTSSARTSAKKTKRTSNKTVSNQEELQRKQRRARLMEKINNHDPSSSSEDSSAEPVKQVQAMDVGSSDSDMEKDLQARFEERRKSQLGKKSPSKEMDHGLLDDSDSDDMENFSRGLKPLNPQNHNLAARSFDSDSSSSDMEETDKENAPSRKANLEVIELNTQDDDDEL